MEQPPALPMPIDRFRRYDLKTKSYRGFYAGKKMTRKLFSEVSGISIQCLKAHDHHPELKLRPPTLRKLAKLEIEVSAHLQTDMIDHKAELVAAKLAAKAAAARERARDRALDAAMQIGRA